MKNKNLILKLIKNEQLSTCSAKKIACIIFDEKDNFIFSLGHNHSINKNENCNDKFIKIDNQWYYKENNDKDWEKDLTNHKHKEWSESNEVHAEMEAINNLKDICFFNFVKRIYFCYRLRKSMKDNTLSCIVTYSPCKNCIKSLISFGIKNIYYFYEFDDIGNSKKICFDNAIRFYKIRGKQLSFYEKYKTY